jgi:hypothetical protein
MAKGGISEEAIRERAYHIWVREGCPPGRQHEHWVQAQVELEAEQQAVGRTKKAPAKRPAAARVRKASKAAAKPAAAKPARTPAARAKKKP